MDIELIEHLPIGLVIWHLSEVHDVATFHLLTINRVARHLLGQAYLVQEDAAAGVIGLNQPDPFPAFFKIEHPRVYIEVIQSGKSRDLGEVWYRDEHHTERILNIRLFPLPDQRLGALLEDISDRKRAEDQLKTSKQKLSFHVQQTPLAVIEWNLEGQVVEWNPAAERMFGHKRRQALGYTAPDLIVPPTDHPHYQRCWAQLLAQREAMRCSGQHVTREGKPIICEWYNTPLLDEMDHVIGVISLAEDVTQQRHAQAAIRESEIRYRRLFEAFQDGILILDAETAWITDANPQIQTLLGYERTELIHKTLVDIGLVSSQAEYEGMLQTLQQVGVVCDRPIQLYTHTQQTVIVERISTLYAAGRHRVIQCQIRDITAQYQAEEQLKQFANRLMRSNQELQDFACIASHDLREPLRKIRVLGDRLAECYADQLPDEAQDYIQRMRQSAQRMQSLIDDLLALSRVTTKAQPFVKVALTAVVQEVLSDLDVTIQQLGGTVIVEPLPTVDADPLQMRQLFQNLISNALKFHHPQQSPSVHIYSPTEVSEPALFQDCAIPSCERVCQIYVSDNGIGFDEQYREAIFTPFQRLHGQQDYDGNGIGLAICRKIVERHGGKITAHSQLGQGTTFIVTLPLPS